MTSSLVLNALGACSLLAIASCGSSEGDETQVEAVVQTSEPSTPVDGPSMVAESNRGTFAIEVTPMGGPIPLNEAFVVMVNVADPMTGAPFTEFDGLTLDARMPAHDHGLTRDVELVPTETPGQFMAEGVLFHMIGHWEFHVDMIQGPRMERAQVSTTLEF